MFNIPLPLLALIAGAAIAAQANMNAQLGLLLKSSLIATAFAFFSSFTFSAIGMIVILRSYPSVELLRQVPVYLWFSGGLLSASGIAAFYWLLPKMGAGPMFSSALSGQLLFALIAGHYGWFGLPMSPITGLKIIGGLSLLFGIVLIHRG